MSESNCPRCNLEPNQMKVLLYETSGLEPLIVLWDGLCTYWGEHMIASNGYERIDFDNINPVTGSRFTYIGTL